MEKTTNYFHLRMEMDGEGLVIVYKKFVVVAEFFAGPHGEYFNYRVYRPVDDLDQFDITEARLELCTELFPFTDPFETEGEALMAAFKMIDRGYFWEVGSNEKS